MEIEKLKQESDHFLEEKDALQVQSRKLAEESSYAKELASAAAVELKNLAEEVTKLSYQNTKLAAELANAQELARARSKSGLNGMHSNSTRQRLNSTNSRRFEEEYIIDDLKRELLASREREASLEAKLAERELRDAKNQKKIEEGRKREADLENDLAGMWVLVAKLKKERLNGESTMALNSTDISGELMTADDPWQGKTRGTLDAAALKRSLEKEKQRTEEVEALVSQLKVCTPTTFLNAFRED
jgi:centromeric protein E